MKKKTTRYDHYCLEYLQALFYSLYEMGEKLERESNEFCAKKEIADEQLVENQKIAALVDAAIEGKE